MKKLSCAILALALCVPAYAQSASDDSKMPISIDQAIQIAFCQNPEIKAALDQLQKSVGGMAEAKSNFMPKLEAEITHLNQGPGFEFGGFNAIPQYATTGSLNLFMPLDISSKLGFVSDIAKYQYQIDYMSLQSASQKLIYNVKQAYYEVLRAKGQQDVAQAAVDVANKRLKEARDKFAAGTVADFDVTRSEVEVANLNQTLIQSKAHVTIARAGLNRVLGICVTSQTELVDSDINVEDCKENVVKCTAQAYRRRPEIKGAETAVLLSSKNVKLQKTGNKPSLGIAGEVDHNIPAYGFTTGHTTWSALLDLKFSVWDGGMTKAKVAQAFADENKSKDSLEQVKLAVSLEVQTALTSLTEATQRVSTAQENVNLAEKSLKLANDRYDSGITILVEVADAESALTQARFNAVQAKYDYAVALAELQRATSTQPEAEGLDCLGESVKQGKIIYLGARKQSS
ncbi:MAG: TolC family protein [Armatimonadota bacterium]|nr:TolC family protein [bacterium]